MSAIVCGYFIKDFIANHSALLFFTPTFLEMIQRDLNMIT